MRVTTLTEQEAAYFTTLAERDIFQAEERINDLRDKGYGPGVLARGEARLTLARSAMKNLAQNAPRTAEQQAAGLDSSGKPEGARGGN